MARSHQRVVVGFCFILPDLIGVAVFALIPLLIVVVRSFQSAVGGVFVGLANYRSVLGNAAFRIAIGNTARFSAVCIPLLLVSSLLLAVALQSLTAVRKLLRSAFLLPMAVPAASVVLVWRLLFHGNGLINHALTDFGSEPVPWMTSHAAFSVLVVSYLWKNLGYDTILWLAALSAIPADVYEAARVDGAGSAQLFFRITLPNLKGAFYTIAVLSFLNSFKVFREAWLVAGDYPDENMYLLQHLYNNWFRNLSFEKIAAAAVLHALVVLAVIAALARTQRSGG